ncbi:MAG: tetratricopeptide repeat protein [Acidimicrobiales bacterium]
MCHLAGLMRVANRFDESTALYEEALGYLCLRAGPEDRSTIYAEAGLGLTFFMAGRYEEAVPLLRHATSLTFIADGSQREAIPLQVRALGESLLQLGRLDEAETELVRAIEAYRLIGLVDDPLSLRASFFLALCRQRMGDTVGAIELQRAVVERYGRVCEADYPHGLDARFYLARWLHSVNEDAEARVLLHGVLDANDDDDAFHAKVRQLLADIDGAAGSDS